MIKDIHIRIAAAAFAVLCTGMTFSALIHQRAWEGALWASLDEAAVFTALHFRSGDNA